MPDTPPKSFTVDQAAELIGVSPRAMRDLIADGEIKAFDVSRTPGTGRARWRISEQAIQDFQDRRGNQAAAASKPRRRATRRTVPEHV